MAVTIYLQHPVLRGFSCGTPDAAKLFFCLTVDVGHDFESVKADLGCWSPKLKSGGFLVFDDDHAEWLRAMQAVDETNSSRQVVAGVLSVHSR